MIGAMATGNLEALPRVLERKTTLYFTRNAGTAFFRGKTLVAGKDDRVFPLGAIRRVVLVGRAPIDSAVLYRLMRAGIPVDWLDVFGRPLGQLMSLDEDMDGMVSGQAAFADKPAALELARMFLLAKLDNCRETVRRKSGPDPAWHGRRQALLDARDAAGLRGAEGMAAREYFSSWKDILHGFEWIGRHPHPAPDPVNMLLSTGYGILHNRLASSLRHAGLNPRIGFFHMTRGRHCALASDLMEPFRALVDGTVLKLARLGEISPSQFVMRGDRCSCRDNAVFAKVLHAFEEMFATTHVFHHSPANRDAEHACSVNDALDEVAEGFAAHLREGRECFLPRIARCPAT